MKLTSEFSESITGHEKKNEYSGSIFTITINTNKSFNSKNEAVQERLPEIKKCFEELAHGLFTESNLPKLMTGVEYSPNELGEKIRHQIPADIKEINASTQVEANIDVRGFLHLHSVINVIHKGKVQVNLQLLKAVVNRKLNDCLSFPDKNGILKFNKPYINVRGRKTVYAIEQYVK